eukprot:CAMPEP_0116124822 /NCGR_PEP_ID=MMETSP0329-20121206/5486_1 /TAXON_ID=697910 /ORGANISM="Pseudo-nitzschia arenysensis, Strain B593" /LENGTH=102 /DNA_ID=CAMNT_0003618829 /DNA_START=15 /DNA_END=323 /DNA_ORIENTATION=+
MSNRRRANNRGRSRANKTNLDDLDGALSGMIRPVENVKMIVDPAEERRFTMHSSNTETTRSGNIFANSMSGEHIDMAAAQATHSSDFEKHQVNYSATKYIKP